MNRPSIIIPASSPDQTPTTSPKLPGSRAGSQPQQQQQQQPSPPQQVIVHNGRPYFPVQMPGGQIQLIPADGISSNNNSINQNGGNRGSQPSSPILLQMATAQPSAPGLTTVQLMRNHNNTMTKQHQFVVQQQQQQQPSSGVYNSVSSSLGASPLLPPGNGGVAYPHTPTHQHTPTQQQQQQQGGGGNVQAAAAQLLAAAAVLAQQQHGGVMHTPPLSPGPSHRGDGRSSFAPPAHHTMLPALIAANAAANTNQAPGGGPSGRPGRNKGIICKRFMERSSYEEAKGSGSSPGEQGEGGAGADAPPNCKFGHSCPYRHGVSRSTEEPLPRSMCRFFMQGACLRDGCPFFHGSEQELQKLLLTKATTYRLSEHCVVRDAEDPAFNNGSTSISSATSPTMPPSGSGFHQHQQQQQQPRTQYIIVPAPVGGMQQPMQQVFMPQQQFQQSSLPTSPTGMRIIQPQSVSAFANHQQQQQQSNPPTPSGGSPLLLRQPASPFTNAVPQ